MGMHILRLLFRKLFHRKNLSSQPSRPNRFSGPLFHKVLVKQDPVEGEGTGSFIRRFVRTVIKTARSLLNRAASVLSIANRVFQNVRPGTL